MTKLSVVILSLMLPWPALAQHQGGGHSGDSGSGFTEKYERRTQERFDMFHWLIQQKQIRAAQDAKYGRKADKGLWFTPDLLFQYLQETPSFKRDGVDLGTGTLQGGRAQLTLNNFFVTGTTSRSLNIDLGVEALYQSTGQFQAATTQTTVELQEKAAGIVIRPFGRSSQDTGLLVKGGMYQLTEKGLWSNTTTSFDLKSGYWGAEAKLYLLPFLGGHAEYVSVFPATSSGLQGQWQMQRFRYGGFIEFLLLNLEVYAYNTDFAFTPQSGGPDVHDRQTGIGLMGTVHF